MNISPPKLDQWQTRRLDTINNNHTIEIEPPKARHDVTKLDLTIPLLFLWYIVIDLSIQPMSPMYIIGYTYPIISYPTNQTHPKP